MVMKSGQPKLCRRLGIAMLATLLLSACGTDTAEWKEEVLLHDGRMIVVERKAKAVSSGFPNANRGRDLEFELWYRPMGIHWKGTLQQGAFEIIDGTAYLALWLNGPVNFCKDRPPTDLPIKVLKLREKEWIEIPQSEFPMDRADYNLYGDYWGNSSSEDAKGLISWKKKSEQYPALPGVHDISKIPRRPYKFREFFEKNQRTCASFQ